MDKNEILKTILSHLEKNPHSHIEVIRSNVKNELEKLGIIGVKTEGNNFHSTSWYEEISHKDALLINEVIYDLLYERILTPGSSRNNLELPNVHVSDVNKLNQKLSELNKHK